MLSLEPMWSSFLRSIANAVVYDLSDEELAFIKRGLIGLSSEITEWMPRRTTWLFRRADHPHAEAGRDVLSKIEALLQKLDTIEFDPEEIIVQDIEEYD